MEKVDQKIKTNLFSADTSIVLAALNTIKQKGNKLYIPILFDLLFSKPEKEIEDEIKFLLANVKDKDTVDTLVSIFDNSKYRPIWKTVLTCCWQNGLDFSDYTPLFIDLIIKEDWEVAFEAFTIIDNLEFLPDEKTIDLSKKMILKALQTADEQKAYFLNAIDAKL